jgi:ketosteroid isomerase-like protein
VAIAFRSKRQRAGASTDCSVPGDNDTIRALPDLARRGDTGRAMSQENVEVVRQPVAVRSQSRRRLEESLGVRFPAALRLIARVFWRLPPRSRLRRAVIRRVIQVAYEATNRGDYEAAFGLYHPDVELIVPPEFTGLGLDTRYRGRQERFDFQRRVTAEWGELRFEPEEVIDLGSRVLVIARITGSGLGSGVPVDNEWANLITFSAGQVTREQAFMDHREALEAAGLRE